MTGPKGNSEFCFPETLNVSQGKVKENIQVDRKQNSLFLTGPVVNWFVMPLNSELETTVKSWRVLNAG